MTVAAKERRAREGPGPRRATPREIARVGADSEDRQALLSLVDDLAVLAADLWFAGRLDRFPVHEATVDEDEDQGAGKESLGVRR